jgi:predicted ATPase
MRRDLADDASSLASEMSSIHNFSEARSKAGRIVAAIRNLMEIWSKYNPQPLIFVCDDLQWADRNSLALFSQLAKNPHEMPYFFIATVRGDLETMYPLNKQIKDIGSYPYVHCMLLSPLDAMEISRIIAQVLRKDVEEIQPLGEVLHSKTGGNPFVLVEFMELLTSKQFIYYSLQTYTWEWNLKQISSQTDVSENIAKLVLENLDTLDPNVKTVLARAAAIGLSVFSSCLLLETLQDDLECVSTLSELERYLSIAAKDGFLEHVDRHFGTWSVYKFSHDKVKESTASLLPCGDEKKALHFSIGNRMMAALSTLKIQKTENFADVYMLAMLHINSALDLAMALPDDEERCYLAKCNYHAAEMALDTASYQLASNYLEAGLSLLDRNNNDDSWNSNYDLKYILCNAGCFIFFSCGEAKKCEKMINEVLDHARSLEEKLPAYNILIWHKMQHESGDEALEVTREVIVMLYGHRFPVSFPNLRIMRGFIFLKRKLSNLTDDEILGLKDINDPTQVRVVEFLNTFVTIGTFSSNPASSILGAMKAIQFTLKNGVCAGSDFAFATMAALFGKFLFIDESYRMGQLAIKLSERTKSPMIQARTIAWATVFGIHFKTPLMSCLNRSLEAA